MLRRLKRLRDENPEFEMSTGDADKLSRINTFLKAATSSVLDLDKARAKVREEANIDVLLVQLRHEFALAAKSFTDDEIVILMRNISAAALPIMDRVRTERFGLGRWVTEGSEPIGKVIPFPGGEA